MPQLTSHLFKMECRRSRLALGLYLLACLGQAGLGMGGPDANLALILRGFLTFAQGCFALLVVVACILGDPMTSTSAGWMTRPIARRDLFIAKFRFLVGLVQGSFLLSLIPGWIGLGFTFTQIISAATQWAIISSGILWPAIAVISWAGDFKSLAARGGATIGAMTGFVALCDRLGLNHPHHSYETSREITAVVLAFGIMAGGGLFAWLANAWRRRLSWSVASFAIGFVAAMFFIWKWPFNLLHFELPVLATTECRLITATNLPPAAPGDNQRLWSHFEFTNMPSNQIAIPILLNGKFTGGNGRSARFDHHSSGRDQSVSEAYHYHQGTVTVQGEVQRRLRAFYPPDTLWFTENRTPDAKVLPLSESHESHADWLANGARGRFTARLWVNLVDLRRCADLPLRAGAKHAADGVCVSVQSLETLEAGERVMVRESVPSLWFTTRHDFFVPRHYRPFCLYVVYDPDTGEARPIDSWAGHRYSLFPLNNNLSVDLRFTITRSALRSQLAGSPLDGASKLRLHVYAPRTIGRGFYSFDDRDHVWQRDRNAPGSRHQPDTRGLDELHWPGPEDPAAGRYIDAILSLQPHHPSGEFARRSQAKLAEIGKAGLPLLIERLPVRDGIRYGVVDPVLRRLVDRSHLEPLKAALRRSPELAQFFAIKRWEAEAAEVILPLLHDHPVPLPASALSIAAKFARPEDHDALRRHAILTPDPVEYLLPSLKKLPGFPFDETVEKRWRRQRVLGVPHTALAAYAARLGHQPALVDFVVQLEEGLDERRGQRLLAVVREAVEFTGTDEQLKTWLSEHLDRLRFDPVLKRFRL